MPEGIELDLSAPEAQEAIKTEAAKLAEGLAAKNKELLAEKKKLQDRIRALPDDFDPEDYAKLRAEREQREREQSEKKGEFEKLRAKDAELFAKREAEYKAALADMEAALTAEMVEARAVEAITAAEGSVKLLLPHVKSAARIVKGDDGKRRTVVVGDDGEPLLKADAKSVGDHMTLKDFVLSLRDSDEFAGAFRGTGSSGSGAPSIASAGSAPGTIRYDESDPMALGRLTTDQLAAIRAGKLKVVG